jgi:hypothetical protein
VGLMGRERVENNAGCVQQGHSAYGRESDSKCAYDVTLRCGGANFVVVERQ